MADLTVVAANARPAVVGHSVIAVAGVALTALQPVYLDGTTGKLALGDGSAAGTAGIIGLAAKAVAANEAVTVLGDGSIVAGVTLTQNYGTRVYLSDTAGAMADAAGTVAVTIGRVIPGLASSTYDKVILVKIEHVATTA